MELSLLRSEVMRTKLSQVFNHWLKVPEDKLQIIIEVIEMLHSACLLTDDTEDSSNSNVIFQWLTASMVSHLSLILLIMSIPLAWNTTWSPRYSEAFTHQF